jgi:hypothetical protein
MPCQSDRLLRVLTLLGVFALEGCCGRPVRQLRSSWAFSAHENIRSDEGWQDEVGCPDFVSWHAFTFIEMPCATSCLRGHLVHPHPPSLPPSLPPSIYTYIHTYIPTSLRLPVCPSHPKDHPVCLSVCLSPSSHQAIHMLFIIKHIITVCYGHYMLADRDYMLHDEACNFPPHLLPFLRPVHPSFMPN